LSAGAHHRARLRHGGRRGAARHQLRNFAGLLPARHALTPHQRVWPDGPPGDQVAKLGFRIRTLLLALRRIKPGPARHLDTPLIDLLLVSRLVLKAAQRHWRRTGPILTDDPIACTETQPTRPKCFPPP